jgi:hypothetical protein
MNEEEIGKHIVDAAVNVHTTLGPPLSVFASSRDPYSACPIAPTGAQSQYPTRRHKSPRTIGKSPFLPPFVASWLRVIQKMSPTPACASKTGLDAALQTRPFFTFFAAKHSHPVHFMPQVAVALLGS